MSYQPWAQYFEEHTNHFDHVDFEKPDELTLHELRLIKTSIRQFQRGEHSEGKHLMQYAKEQTAYTGDMGAFNYLARTRFNANLHHGAPVNTVFKSYENERTDCWFRHK